MSPIAGILLSLCALVAATAQDRSDDTDQDLVRVLSRWHKAYAGESLRLDEMARTDGRTQRLYGKDVLPKHEPAQLTHREALRFLLARALERQTPDVTKELLRLAAVGLGDAEYALDRTPWEVRRMTGEILARFKEAAALQVILQTAAGDERRFGPNESHRGLRIAALATLGAVGRPVFRPTIEQAMQSGDPRVRTAAAEALRVMARPQSLDALTAALGAETDPSAAQLEVLALQTILRLYHERIDAAEIRRALSTAIDVLGRTDWRTDLAIVDLLAEFRVTTVIEPLIGVLDRCVTPDGIAADKVSGLLKHRTWQVLKSLSGAIVPMDRPDLWREFWQRERDSFVLPPGREQQSDPSRTVSGFFGIPVEGSRVVFVIDVSGSMDQLYRPSDADATAGAGTTGAGEARTRLWWAKHELLTAAESLPPDAQFNVVAFAGEVRRWRDRLSPADASNKAALRTMLKALGAVGATNVFGGLQQALAIKSQTFGARYESNVDEVFLLSDGEPTAGDIVDPVRILELIRETNRFSKVRINTVFMGGADSPFMRQLAEENGGRYVRL